MTSTGSSRSLQQCYSFLLPDCDENSFYTEYNRAADLLKDCDCKTTLSYLQKLHELCPDDLSLVKCGLARVAAAKPHSADVKRLINAYNKFKDNDRSSLSPASLFNYLFVNTNMTTVEEFDPRPATEFWLSEKNKRSRKQIVLTES